MIIIGCDFHPSFQQIDMLDTDTGEVRQLSLAHKEQARVYYAALQGREVVIGVEVCGYTGWFEEMAAEMGHCLLIGDAAAIRATMTRKQKTDKRDAEQIRKLLVEDRFPRIWTPSPQERDVRQLIVHRHKRVQMRTRVKNQLQALAIHRGLRLRRKLWTGGAAAAGGSGTDALRGATAAGFVDAAGADGARPRATGPSRGARSPGPAASGAFDDPSRGGAGNCAGLRVDPRGCQAVPARPPDGQLPGTDSVRGQLGWQATPPEITNTGLGDGTCNRFCLLANEAPL